MSGYRYSNSYNASSNSRRSASSHKVLHIVEAVLFILMALTIVFESLEIGGKGKVKPSNWFKKEEAAEETVEPEKSEEAEKETANLEGYEIADEMASVELNDFCIAGA